MSVVNLHTLDDVDHNLFQPSQRKNERVRQYTLNFVVSHLWQPKCMWYYGVCSVNMDVWYYRISVECDIME